MARAQSACSVPGVLSPDARDLRRSARHRGHRSRGVAAALAGALFSAALASPPWPAAGADEREPPSRPLVEGKTVFDAKGCSHCHGILGGKGEPRVGPDLGRERSWHDLMQLAGSFWNHAPAMLDRMQAEGIERPTLSSEDMGRLSSYLLYLNFLDEPGDAEHGRRLFATLSCERCHQLGGRWGTIGPRLDELTPYASALFMAQALWNHGPEMTAKMAELKIARPHLGDDDVANLVAFMRGPGRPPVSAEEIAAQLGSPRSGKVLFSSKGCMKCHAIAGRGATIGPDLGRRPMGHVGQMAGALWNHGPAMWAKMETLGVAFPRLDGPETSDLLAYLYFVQYMDDRGDATRGAEIFREKSCAACHAPDEGSARVGPDLFASEAVRSPLRWASTMWNHAPAMAKKVRESGFQWPRFADDEMRDLVAFLRSRVHEG